MRPLIVITEHIIKRFYAYVDVKEDDNCWNWQGNIKKDGYGGFKINYYVHRSNVVAFVIHNKCDPIGSVIRHSCDNRKCCNHKHLLEGTVQDNSDDMVNRGRSKNNSNSFLPKLSGILCSNTYLTEEDIREIRWLANFISSVEISKMPKFKNRICRQSINKIINRETWKEIK